MSSPSSFSGLIWQQRDGSHELRHGVGAGETRTACLITPKSRFIHGFLTNEQMRNSKKPLLTFLLCPSFHILPVRSTSDTSSCSLCSGLNVLQCEAVNGPALDCKSDWHPRLFLYFRNSWLKMERHRLWDKKTNQKKLNSERLVDSETLQHRSGSVPSQHTNNKVKNKNKKQPTYCNQVINNRPQSNRLTRSGEGCRAREQFKILVLI